MSTITTINATDLITDSRADINTNFANLNADKIETSVLDTDTALAANSDAKIPSQKAVKAYADSLGGLATTTSGVGTTPSSSSTQTITHSLGRVPKTIRITGFGGSDAGAANAGSSHGTYNSTGNRCVYVDSDDAQLVATSTTFAISLTFVNAAGAIRWTGTAVIQNVGSTTFDLVWTVTAPDAHTLAYLWEAA